MRFSIDGARWFVHADRVEDAFNDANNEFASAIRKEALAVKTDWAGQWAPSTHLPYLGASVSYDTRHAGGVHTAEIGPDKLRPQGPLGTLIEDANGGARNRATHAGNSAGRRAEPRLADAAGDAAEKGIGG